MHNHRAGLKGRAAGAWSVGGRVCLCEGRGLAGVVCQRGVWSSKGVI